MLIPTDQTMGKKAAENMRQICANDNYGYSQPNRWTGAKSIDILGIANGHGDFDCSSLCIECYRIAGLKHKLSGYSGSIVKSFLATGKFKAYTDDAHIGTEDYAVPGAVYVGNGHVCMALDYGSKAGKEDVTPDPIDYGITPPYVEVLGNSVFVRSGAGKEYKKEIVAHKGDKYKYITTDEHTGWYWIDTVKGRLAITNKPKYTKLVLQ